MNWHNVRDLVLYGIRDVHSFGEYKAYLKREWSIAKAKSRMRSHYLLLVYFLLIGLADILSTRAGLAMGFTEKNMKQAWLINHSMALSNLAVLGGIFLIFFFAMFIEGVRVLKVVMLFYYTMVVANFALLYMAIEGKIIPF